MKKILITTMLGIATTAAFGAASLRTPQLGGGTTTAATTPTTARAGTMRAQTMKTSSVSTPSVTTTQSIATPVSTETTDARIALLKGIKGFNPGKIKDTATAQQELNAIDSRIEELQTQLDRAEAAQSSVITEANIDAKITEKLTALGTTPVATDTYSKAEVDNLLNDIKRKLPVIDNDRGTISIFGTNGELISVPYLKYWLMSTYEDPAHPYLYSIYIYRGTPSNTTWQTWENQLCSAYNNEFHCCIEPRENDQFHVAVAHNGYKAHASQVITLDDGRRALRQQVSSFQYTDTESLQNAICGNTSVSECWVEGNAGNFGSCNILLYSGNSYQIISNGSNEQPRYYLVGETESPQIPHTDFWYVIYPLDVSVSNETYDEWESALCEPYSDEPACCLRPYHDPNYGTDYYFHVNVPHNGYKLSMPMGPQIVTLSNGKRALKLNVQSFQYTDTASIQTAVCGTASTNDCWIEGWENYGPSVNSCGLSGYSGYAYWAM